MNVSSARCRTLGLFLVLVTHTSGIAAERVVRLDVPAQLGKDRSAYPRIAAPVDAAERKINAAVARLDTKVQKAAADCAADAKGSPAGNGSWWERTIRVPMQGPRYISYVIVDNFYCGGAHPNISEMAIVYDLATGNPIDWSMLLPSSLTGKLQLSEGADGTRMIALSGKALYDLYLKRYSHRAEDSKDTDEDKQCREAVSTAGFDGKPPGMMAWLDATQAALVVYFDLAHAVQACADEVAIPASILRTEGAKSMLLEALQAAHRASTP